METLMIILSGVLVTVATYLLLSKSVIRVVLATAILSHAAHILLMAMGGFRGNSVPIIKENSVVYADALPQALILTSIVISFCVTAFFLVLAYRTYLELGTDNLDQLRGNKR